MEFYNDKDFFEAIMDDLDTIQMQVSNNILENVKQSIYDVVYKPHNPARYKRRNFRDTGIEGEGGFWSSWETYNLYGEGGHLEPTTIWSNPMLMDYDGDSYVHGNPQGIDRRGILDRAIAEGTDYDFDMQVSSEYAQGRVDAWAEKKAAKGDIVDEDAKKAAFEKIKGKRKKGWWQEPRDYWSEPLEYISGGRIDYETGKMFHKLGIKFTRI